MRGVHPDIIFSDWRSQRDPYADAMAKLRDANPGLSPRALRALALSGQHNANLSEEELDAIRSVVRSNSTK